MSTKLKDLIRSIRSCKTASDERAVISQECAMIRTAFRDNESHHRPRCVAKLLFISMLGYPTYFGQMECVKLIGSSQFSEKRIGYLGLTQLLDENSEVLMLVTNSIKKDMHHTNQYINGLALSALGNIASAEMCRALYQAVEELIGHSNPYIKKKATLCVMKLYRKREEPHANFDGMVGRLLQHRNHGVILAGCSLLMALLEVTDKNVKQYRNLVPQMVQILKKVINLSYSYAGEYDSSGVSDPFLQSRLMQILRILAKNSTEASEEISDVLAQIATNTTGGKTVDHCILYECVRTIIFVESEPGLMLLGINVLGRFLQHRDSNLRYVSLCLLQHVVKVDIKAVQRHRANIMECLTDADIAIRRRALDVTSLLVNEENIKTMTKELLNCLLLSDVEFKADIVAKICVSLDRFSPSRRWHIETLLKVMCLAGNYVQEEVRDTFVNLVLTSSELRTLVVFKLFYSLKENPTQEALVQAAVWCIGEFGDLMIAPPKSGDEEGFLPAPIATTEILDLLESISRRVPSIAKVQNTTEFILTAYVKLAVRFPTELPRIKKLLKKYASSMALEIQQRATEFELLLSDDWNSTRAAILERIPITDILISYQDKRRAASRAEVLGKRTLELQPAEALDLLDLEVENNIPSTVASTTHPLPSSSSATVQKETDILDALFGDITLGTPSSSPASPSNGAPFAVPPAQPAVSPSGNEVSLADIGIDAILNKPLDQNHGGDVTKANEDLLNETFVGQTLPAIQKKSLPSVVVYEEEGIKIVFDFAKDEKIKAECYITAHFKNYSDVAVTAFVLEVAVPNYVDLKMFPTTSTTLESYAKNSISQQMIIKNKQFGVKTVMMRLRISYQKEGQMVTKMAKVSNLPSAL